MGKKSKRKSNTKSPSCCYHGCTKKEFNNCAEFYKTLDSYDKCRNGERTEFIETKIDVIVNPKFGRFVIARVTDDYLEGKNNDILHFRLLLLVDIRYWYIPIHEGKDVGPESEYARNFKKYSRDILTERGRINCMAREIPCDCMEEKRIEAKSMAKVANCFRCYGEFPKEKMLRCKGCDLFQYCSKECRKKQWPRHKEYCRKEDSSAIPISASVPSSSVEPSDVDV